MQTFNQLFFKKKQIFSYFFKEISDNFSNALNRNLNNNHENLNLYYGAA